VLSAVLRTYDDGRKETAAARYQAVTGSEDQGASGRPFTTTSQTSRQTLLYK